MTVIPPVAPIGISPEFTIPPVEETAPAAEPGEGFGDLLASKLESLDKLQADASAQAEALATGKADDVTSVVMAVERANLGMQLAVQVRNKAVEAYQEIFRMHV